MILLALMGCREITWYLVPVVVSNTKPAVGTRYLVPGTSNGDTGILVTKGMKHRLKTVCT